MLEGTPQVSTAAPQVDNPAPEVNPEPVQQPGAPETPAEPAPQTYEPGDRSPELLAKLLDGAEPGELFGQPAEPTPDTPPAPGNEPPQPIPAPEFQVPDKFKNPDGTLNTDALVKSYSGLEKKLGEQGQSLGQMQQLAEQNQQMQAYIQQVQQIAAAQPQPQQQLVDDTPKFPWEVEMTPEEKEAWQEKFYEDPIAAQAERDKQTIKAMEHRTQQMLQQALEPFTPIVQQHQYQQQVNGFQEQIAQFTQDAQHADFFDLQPQMQQVIQKYGDSVVSLPNAVEVLYTMAKGMTEPPPAPPTPEQMLQEPEYRQKILSDQSLRNEILKGYVEQVKQGQPPVTIGSQPGGAQVATPSEKPRSVREASTFVNQWLRGGGK